MPFGEPTSGTILTVVGTAVTLRIAPEWAADDEPWAIDLAVDLTPSTLTPKCRFSQVFRSPWQRARHSFGRIASFWVRWREYSESERDERARQREAWEIRASKGSNPEYETDGPMFVAVDV